MLWPRTLREMALMNARILDQVTVHGRLDLISPVQLRTLEILNRLAHMKVNESRKEGTDEDRARALLLEALGDGA